jgi:hypothetical protein
MLKFNNLKYILQKFNNLNLNLNNLKVKFNNLKLKLNNLS